MSAQLAAGPGGAPAGGVKAGEVLLDVRDLRMYFPVTEGIVFHKVVAEVKAVDGVSFQIHKGETLGLLHSVPRLDQPRKAKLDPIEGQPPDLTRLGAGCAFRPRCRFSVERCAQEIPALETVGEGHFSACWQRDQLGQKPRDAS